MTSCKVSKNIVGWENVFEGIEKLRQPKGLDQFEALCLELQRTPGLCSPSRVEMQHEIPIELVWCRKDSYVTLYWTHQDGSTTIQVSGNEEDNEDDMFFSLPDKKNSDRSRKSFLRKLTKAIKQMDSRFTSRSVDADKDKLRH